MNGDELRNPNIRLAEDMVPGYLLWITLAVILITIGGVLWAWALYQDGLHRHGGFLQPVPGERAPRAIEGVNQTLILLDRHGQRMQRDQLRALDGFGWVDPQRGVVHIPIDEAMRLRAEEGRR